MLMTTPCFPTVDIIPRFRDTVFGVTHSYISRKNIPIKARRTIGSGRKQDASQALKEIFSQVNALKTGTDVKVLLHRSVEKEEWPMLKLMLAALKTA